MFRQAGMSKQPMGILASSPELMTTAQKAMMNNKPIKAQKAVSVNTNTPNFIDSLFGTNIGSYRYMQPGNSILKDLKNNFSFGGSDTEKTYETKLIPEGAPTAGFVETTQKPKKKNQSLFGVDIVGPDGKPMKEGDSIDSISGTPLKDIPKINKKYQQSLVVKKGDSEFTKDIKGFMSSVGGGYDTIVKKIDDGLNYFRNQAEKEKAVTNRLSGMQADLNARASVDPQRNIMATGGDPDGGVGDKLVGPSRLAPPSTEERGLVDPNVLSPDDPRFPEAFPMAKPAEVAGLSVIDKIKEDAKNPKGTTTKGSDEALGIADLSFKDRVKARRDIISAALGRDVAEKDVRTDVNYNLIMTGLLVAAGESPNAMTNIAKGLAAGLAGYGKAAGESAEAKRKEEIAIGLAAVEQEFKSDEAQKARDKDPDSIRVAKMLQEQPDLIPILQSIKAKKQGKSIEEIRLSLTNSLSKAGFGQPPLKSDVDALTNIVLGIESPEQIPQIITSFRIPQNVVGTETYKPGKKITYNKNDYIVSDDGLTVTLDTTQKSS